MRPPFCKPYSWEATLKDFRCALDYSLNILDEGITDLAGSLNLKNNFFVTVFYVDVFSFMFCYKYARFYFCCALDHSLEIHEM